MLDELQSYRPISMLDDINLCLIRFEVFWSGLCLYEYGFCCLIILSMDNSFYIFLIRILVCVVLFSGAMDDFLIRCKQLVLIMGLKF